ncbi:MAG: hypothetical protein J1E02_00225 [Coprobacter sp.]|nr:hypothetical protein [Coprobacter sp.]
MDKSYFSFDASVRILLFSFLLFSGYSCIDNRYDLNKDISTNVGMDGELGFPLGETEEKALRDLLSPGDIADLDTTDGAYGIHKQDVITASIDKFSDISSINEILAYTEEFDITFKNITLDPIQIAGDSWNIALSKNSVNIPEIAFSFKDSNSDLSVSQDIPATPSGIPVSLPVTLSPQPASFTIAPFDCPDGISSISSLKFNGTNNAAIVWDLSALQQELSLSDGSVTAADFQINFPSGFVLSNPSIGEAEGNKLILKKGETLVFGKNTINFTISEYNRKFERQGSQMGGVEESITFGSGNDNSLSIVVSGVTSGISAGYHQLSMPLTLSSSLVVGDMNLTIDNLNFDFEGLNVTNDPIKVTGIHNLVDRIDEIDFVENTVLTVESSPLDLGGLTLTGGNIYIDFSSKFVFDESNSNWWENGRLIITPAELKSGFSKPLTVLAMDLSAVELHKEVDADTKWFEFEPEVIVSPAALSVSGETMYSRLKTFQNSEMQLTIPPTVFAIEDGECKTDVYTTRMDETAEFDVVDVDIPDEIKNLGWIHFKEPRKVKMEITIDGIPTTASDLYFQTVYLDFPDFLELSENGTPLPLYQDEDGKQYCRLELSGKEGLFAVQGASRYWSNDERLSISGLDLTKVENLKIENGKMSFSESAKVNGVVVLDKSTLELSDLNGRVIHGQASVAVEDKTEIGVVAGEISDNAVKNLDLHTTIDLGDLGEYLGEGSKLYLPRVNFKMQASNPLGVGVDCDLVFTPYKGGRAVEPQSVQIAVGAYDNVEDIENTGITNLMIVGKEYPADAPAPEGYEKVVFDGLSKVLEDIPDSIVIEAKPQIQAPKPGEWHTVNLGRDDNDITFAYEVGVPFALGEGIQIVYRDTIADIQKDLDGIFDKVSAKEIILNVKVTNGIPLNLKLELTPLGPDSKKPLEGLKVLFNDDSKGNIAAGSYNFETQQTAPAVSVIQIRIVDETPKSTALRQLDGLDLRLEGGLGDNEGTEGGIPLKPSQSIKVKVGAKIKGLEADIDNF